MSIIDENEWVREPDPIQNNYPAVWDLVIADLTAAVIGNTEQAKIRDLLVEDCKLRDFTGTKKYKTRLQPFNGRKNYKDAYEEFLDASVYLRAECFEAMMPVIITPESERYAAAIQNLYRVALDCSLKLRYILEMKKEQDEKVVVLDNTESNTK